MFGPRARISPSSSRRSLHPRQRQADGAESVVVMSIGGQRRAGLREPVALQDEQAGGVKELGDLPCQRRPAGHEVTQPPAERVVEFVEHQPVRQAFVSGCRPSGNGCPCCCKRLALPPDADAPVEDGLLDRRPGSAGLHAGVNLFVHPRHAHHQHGPDFTHVLRQRVDAFREGGGPSLCKSRGRIRGARTNAPGEGRAD